MDHCEIFKNDVILSEIKIEDHSIKVEQDCHQESTMENNILGTDVKIELDFAIQNNLSKNKLFQIQ